MAGTMQTPWEGYFPAFRIFGNLYFAGTMPASTHVIDTGDGLILLDSGYQESLYLVLHGLHTLGLDERDIRYIVHTHGHIDHIGGTRALVELSGAKTFLGAADRQYANGELNLTYAAELGLRFDGTFEPDVLLRDGDIIRLGSTAITCRATPGHTPGTMSFFFDVTDGESTFRAGLHGGSGINTMCRKFLDKYGLSYDCRTQFLQAMDRLQNEPVDIFLGNHMHHNRTPEKYQRLQTGDRLAFIAPDEWCTYALEAKSSLLELLEQEQMEDMTSSV